jgi:hypothetical protein
MKGFTKSKVILGAVAALVVVALVVAMVFALKGCQKDPFTQGDSTSQTAPSGSDPVSATDDPVNSAYTVTFIE